MRRLITSALILAPLSTAVAAAAYPEWRLRPQVPECPVADLLPENYPLAGIVVSDKGSSPDPEFTIRIIEKVLRAANDELPLILLPVSTSMINKIYHHIDSLQVPLETKVKWKKVLVRTRGPSYTWQRDITFSNVDQKTGLPAFRELTTVANPKFPDVAPDSNPLLGQSFKTIAYTVSRYGWPSGFPLNWPVGAGGINQGGNFVGIPGGICAIGDKNASADEWAALARAACPGETTERIKISTGWLGSVGHVDEIIKILPDRTQSAPCDFAIAIASPQKALELLKQSADEFFFSPPARGEGERRLRSAQRISQLGMGLYTLCDFQIHHASKSSLWRTAIGYLQQLLRRKRQPAAQPDFAACPSMKNGEALQAMQSEMSQYILGTEASIQQTRSSIQAAMQKSLPQCKPRFVELPVVFSEGGVSIAPNVINSITVGSTNIMPNPSNAAFERYVTAQMDSLGIHSEFIDSFLYAEVGGGNIHCATQTVYTCRPSAGRR